MNIAPSPISCLIVVIPFLPFPSRFVVEFNISSFVMYNHPPYILKRPNVPSAHGTNGRHRFRSCKRAFLESWYCTTSRITDRSGGSSLLPRFTTESSHQISCLPFVVHHTHRVYVVPVYFCSYCVPVISLVPHHFPLLLRSNTTRPSDRLSGFGTYRNVF